jgi:hypothetical protein
MAIFAISNPTKRIVVDFPLDQVRKSIKNISLLNSRSYIFVEPNDTAQQIRKSIKNNSILGNHNYILVSSNDTFNKYTYSIPQTMSFGSFADIHINSISDNKTEIAIEIRRKMGTFDKSYEVTSANHHIQNLIDYLSKLIVLTDVEVQALQPKRSSKKKALLFAVFSGFFGGHRFYTGKPVTALLQLFTLGIYGLWVFWDIYKILTNKYRDGNTNLLENDFSF